MPRGDKSSYTDKQKRKAEHIEEGYEKRGVSHKEAESRAWATVTGASRAAARSRARVVARRRATPPPARAARKGGSVSQSGAKRSAAAKKGWETRRHAAHG